MKKIQFYSFFLVSIFLATFLSLSFVESINVKAEEINLKVWTMLTVSTQVDNLKEDLNEFEKLNPGIKVSLEAVSYDTVYQRLLTSGSVGESPDVFNCIEAMVAFMQARGQIESVDDVIQKLGGDNFFKSYLSWIQRDGHYWAVPDWALHQGVYYRKSLFKKNGFSIPKTWDELLEIAKKLNVDDDGDGNIDHYGMGIPLGKHMVAQQTLGAIMYSNGIHIFNPLTGEYEFGVKKNQFIESIDFLINLYNSASPKASINWSWADYRNAFVKGMTNMTIGWGAEVLIAMKDNPELLDDIGIFPFPSGPSEKSYPSRANFGGGYFFTISNNGAQRVEAAKKLLVFLYNNGRAAKRSNTRPIFAMPAYKPALSEYYSFTIPNQFKEIIKIVETQIMPYEFRHGLEAGLNPVAGEIEGSDIFGDAIHSVIFKNWSYEKAFEWLNNEIRDLINQISG